MHHSAANEPPYQSNPISQLSQLTIQIQSTALDLSNYECFIGSENIGFIMEGTEQMMFALQNVLGGPNPEGKLGERETRHEFRNKLAVIKMDLPQNHAAFLPLQRLSERCTRFSAVLDGFAATGLVQTYRMAG
jgi:hypothetical protein